MYNIYVYIGFNSNNDNNEIEKSLLYEIITTIFSL